MVNVHHESGDTINLPNLYFFLRLIQIVRSCLCIFYLKSPPLMFVHSSCCLILGHFKERGAPHSPVNKTRSLVNFVKKCHFQLEIRAFCLATMIIRRNLKRDFPQFEVMPKKIISNSPHPSSQPSLITTTLISTTLKTTTLIRHPLEMLLSLSYAACVVEIAVKCGHSQRIAH